MKALTLWQPWASLIAIGAKSIETRSWATPYRGRLAIHAAARKPEVWMMEDGLAGDIFDFTDSICVAQWGPTDKADFYPPAPPPEDRWWLTVGPDHLPNKMPLGKVVATAQLVDVVPITGMNDAGHLNFVCPDIGGGLTLYRFSSPDAPAVVERDLTSDRPFGDYSEGRWAWLLEDVEPIEPVPAKGHQQLWEWTP